MSNRTVEILILHSFDDYLDAVDFYNLGLKDQVAYMLFYVTRIAKLRKNMIAKIIADRIKDKYDNKKESSQLGTIFEEVNIQMVGDILSNNPDEFELSMKKDIRDRNEGEKAYILSQKKIAELEKIIQLKWKDKIKKQIYHGKWYIATLAILVLLTGILNITLFHDSSKKLGISWQEYKKRADFENLNNNLKAVYILYYMTEVIEFTKDMTPSVLSDRLVSLNYVDYPIDDSIKSYFERSDLVMKSYKGQDNAYMVTPNGKAEMTENVGLKYNGKYLEDDDVNISWIWRNKPEILYTIISAFLAALVFSGGFLYNLGTKVNILFKE